MEANYRVKDNTAVKRRRPRRAVRATCHLQPSEALAVELNGRLYACVPKSA